MKNAVVEQILLHTCLSSADRLFDRLPAQLLLVGSSEGIKAALFVKTASDVFSYFICYLTASLLPFNPRRVESAPCAKFGGELTRQQRTYRLNTILDELDV